MTGPELDTDDLVALRRLVDAYADAVDRRDADALVSLFAPHGILRVQGDDGPVESEWIGPGVAGSLDVIAGFQRTFHHIGGTVFAAGTATGEASGRVQCIAHHYDRTSNGPVDLVMMIHYHDRYEKTDGWRIRERRVGIEWTELHSAHPQRKVKR